MNNTHVERTRYHFRNFQLLMLADLGWVFGDAFRAGFSKSNREQLHTITGSSQQSVKSITSTWVHLFWENTTSLTHYQSRALPFLVPLLSYRSPFCQSLSPPLSHLPLKSVCTSNILTSRHSFSRCEEEQMERVCHWLDTLRANWFTQFPH